MSPSELPEEFVEIDGRPVNVAFCAGERRVVASTLVSTASPGARSAAANSVSLSETSSITTSFDINFPPGRRAILTEYDAGSGSRRARSVAMPTVVSAG